MSIVNAPISVEGWTRAQVLSTISITDSDRYQGASTYTKEAAG